MLKKDRIFDEMNRLGDSRTPFIFIIDFLKENAYVLPLKDLNDDIQYQINANDSVFNGLVRLDFHPISLENYRIKFENVQNAFKTENIDLINLTCETPIEINLNLEEIYHHTNAKYKLLVKNKFVCFSPETFVQIKNSKIVSYPMKGTIDASIIDAEQKILSDPKEIEEHQITVDGVIKELKKIADNVEVKKFRYLDKVVTRDSTLLQVSSEISGDLPKNYHSQLGTIFNHLLPAVSICGSPKLKAFELIQSVEGYSRGFYSGVFGIYDGNNLDSAVLIRFIEEKSGEFFFKSGGGITVQSDLKNEYNELISKIYVPIN